MLALLLSGAVLLAVAISLRSTAGGTESVPAQMAQDNLLPKSFFLALVCQLCLYYNDLYDFRMVRAGRDLLWRLVQSLGATSILVAILYLLFPRLIIGKGVFFVALLLAATLLLAWRLLYDRMLRLDGFRERVLVIGTGPTARTVAGEVLAQPALGFRLVGYIADEPVLDPPRAGHPPVLGLEASLVEVVQRERVRRVVVARSEARGRLPVEELLACRMAGVKVEEGTSFYKSILTRVIKRLTSVAISVVGLTFTAPLLLVVAVLIRLDSPGPIFFSQERVGQGGKVFALYKFRSMRADAEADGRPVWAEENDPRITRVGRRLRKTRIDEIPQLQYDLFYLKHMSLVLDLSILLETVKVIIFGRGR